MHARTHTHNTHFSEIVGEDVVLNGGHGINAEAAAGVNGAEDIGNGAGVDGGNGGGADGGENIIDHMINNLQRQQDNAGNVPPTNRG